MGGCGSKSPNAEFGAGLGASIGVAAGGVGVLAGAGVGALIGDLATGGCDISKKGVITQLQNITSTSLATSVSGDSSEVATDQQIEIRCNPSLPNGVTVYEDNESCRTCIETVTDGWLRQHEVEKTLIDNDPKSAEVRTPIDVEYSTLASRILTCGLTTCKACALNNVTQTSMISSDSLESDITKIRTTFNDNLSSILSQTFTENTDALSAALSVFKDNPDLDSLTDTIRSKIDQQVTDNFISEVRTQLSSEQTIQVVSTGTTQVSFIDQNAIINVIQQKLNSDQIIEKAFTQASLTAFQKALEDDSTIGELGQFISKTFDSTSSAIGGLAGRIFLSAIAILAVVLVIAIVVLVRSRKRSKILDGRNSDEENSDPETLGDNS
jgi:hypothetical protein